MIETLRKIPWTFKDIVFVSSIVAISFVTFVIILSEVMTDQKVQLYLAGYFCYIILFLLPVVWVKRLYKVTISTFGLQKGNWNKFKIIFVGVAGGSAYFLLYSLVGGSGIKLSGLSNNIVDAVIAPISFGGFPLIILGPISQELYFRSFLYNYFESKVGKFWGLIFQAVLFSVSHIDWFYHYNDNTYLFMTSSFVTGIILAVLYRKANSLYPSIVFHGVFNYLALIAMFSQQINL